MGLGRKRMLAAGVVAIGLFGAACSNYGGDNGGSATTGGASSQPAASASGGGAVTCDQSAGSTTVTESGFKFQPTTLSAKSCTTVALDNKDATTHTFTIDNSPINVTLPGGSKSSAELALPPGNYIWYCRFHGSPSGTGMSGKLTVT
ncbi:MAG: cupredoxin domain-containing protein [Actinomycetota bacterium]